MTRNPLVGPRGAASVGGLRHCRVSRIIVDGIGGRGYFYTSYYGYGNGILMMDRLCLGLVMCNIIMGVMLVPHCEMGNGGKKSVAKSLVHQPRNGGFFYCCQPGVIHVRQLTV